MIRPRLSTNPPGAPNFLNDVLHRLAVSLALGLGPPACVASLALPPQTLSREVSPLLPSPFPGGVPDFSSRSHPTAQRIARTSRPKEVRPRCPEGPCPAQSSDHFDL